jgi:hypothetical protein
MSKFMWCWVGVMCTAILCGVAGYTDWSRQEAKIGSLQAQVKAQQPQGVAPVPSAGAITWRASPIRSEVASTDTRVGITLNDGTAWTWIVRPEVRQERGKWSAALVIIPVDTKERGR